MFYFHFRNKHSFSIKNIFDDKNRLKEAHVVNLKLVFTN